MEDDLKFMLNAYRKLEHAYGSFMLVRGDAAASLRVWDDDKEGLERLRGLLKKHPEKAAK